MINNIFLQISLIFGITVSVAVVIRLLRQPFVVAYIIAGIVAGPLILNLIHADSEFFQTFAQFGTVLLLFLIGLSLNFNTLAKIGKTSLLTASAQLIFTGFFGTVILSYLHYPLKAAILLAVLFTFSSTIIIFKLLSEKRALETAYGRYTIGLLLIQDIFALFLLIFITSPVTSSGFSTISILIAKTLLLLSVMYFMSKVILPIFLQNVAKSDEFLFLFTLAWCFGTSTLLYWAGFSIEIGAIIAGISLGSTPYHIEIMSRLKPLRDFFIILFFIILGSELNFIGLSGALLPSIILSLFILIGNPLILYTIYRSQKFTRRNSFLGSVTAAQVSEFGFIILFIGQKNGLFHEQDVALFTLTALITICLSSYLITYNEQLYKALTPLFRLFGKDKYIQTNLKEKKYTVWVIGYHRIGWKICDALLSRNISFAVIDYNPVAIKKLQERNIPAFFGDIDDIEFLDALSIRKAKLVVSTVPEAAPQLTLLRYLKSEKKEPIIITTLNHSDMLQSMYTAHADYVILPHLLGGQWLADLLKKKSWKKATFAQLQEDQKTQMKLHRGTPK